MTHSLSLSVCEFGKMAEASISVDQDQFICPMCLDLLKDPVAFPCGHGFYKVCINGCWNQKGVYSCPQCRDTFTPLAEVVEKTEVQAASPAHCYTGPGDVECDFCTERKNKAVKSCLVCLASFCEIHLKPHLEIPALKKHTLIEASAELQEKICSEHDEVLKIYCRTDQICICSLCMLDKHKGHDTVSVAAGRAEKVSKIKEEQMKSQQRIQEKQKKVQELKQAVNTLKLSAQIAVEDSEFNIWSITPEEREEHDKQFDLFTHTLGNVSGVQVRKFFLQSGLSASVLAKIWELADMGKDGKMDRLEFSIAMN
ncbi:hypothetical protein PHYPO_G00185130 [Pangasianodon hypophthalmus]|uniref:Uncharacterized protein n=1 Tax=Pangasianodon hypophthalmus TaxID=310915 RepID=A0A5N5JCW7_PANHP|nr:hypothetical protein PHYPO_G00185130 [Pangasianodon hypophthalmus]